MIPKTGKKQKNQLFMKSSKTKTLQLQVINTISILNQTNNSKIKLKSTIEEELQEIMFKFQQQISKKVGMDFVEHNKAQMSLPKECQFYLMGLQSSQNNKPTLYYSMQLKDFNKLQEWQFLELLQIK